MEPPRDSPVKPGGGEHFHARGEPRVEEMQETLDRVAAALIRMRATLDRTEERLAEAARCLMEARAHLDNVREGMQKIESRQVEERIEEEETNRFISSKSGAPIPPT